MWRLLVALGFLLALAGVMLMAFGGAIFISSFGNALFSSGVASLTGGIVLVAVAVVLREVIALTEKVDAALAVAAERRITFQETVEEDGEAYEEFDDEAQTPAFEAEPPRAPPPVSAPPVSPAPPAPAPRAPASPPLPPAFMRPRAPEPAREEASVPTADLRGRILGRPGVSEPPPPLPSAPVAPPPPPLSRSRPSAEPPVVGERSTERAPFGRAQLEKMFAERGTGSAQAPLPPASAPPAPPPPAPRRQDATEPTVLKSGVVGGMAYTLYSDGSIQAELPDGVLRFASLQELRDHVSRAQQPR